MSAGSCPFCSKPVADGSRFCHSCGSSLETSDPTSEATRARTPPASGDPEVRFPTGHVLASRYRIVERIGKGGMGEVYHAEDMTLEQPVALKFLPEAFSSDEERLKRFRREVRIAREIAHPNVCRVYDIAEADGHRDNPTGKSGPHHL